MSIDYGVAFDCTGDNGKNLTGYYKRSLKYYNYVKMKSALRQPDR